MEKENAYKIKRIAASIKKIVEDVSFFMNETTHRKYTEGGNFSAAICTDPSLQEFCKFFSKKENAYNIMGPTTRIGFSALLEMYNPYNPIFMDEVNASMFFGDNSKNIFSSYRPEIYEAIKSIAEGEGDLSFDELEMVGEITRDVSRLYHKYDMVLRGEKSESARVMSAQSYEAQVAVSIVCGLQAADIFRRGR